MAQAKMRHSSLNDTRTPAGCSTKPPFTQTVRARNNSTTDRTSTAVTHRGGRGASRVEYIRYFLPV